MKNLNLTNDKITNKATACIQNLGYNICNVKQRKNTVSIHIDNTPQSGILDQFDAQLLIVTLRPLRYENDNFNWNNGVKIAILGHEKAKLTKNNNYSLDHRITEEIDDYSRFELIVSDKLNEFIDKIVRNDY